MRAPEIEGRAVEAARGRPFPSLSTILVLFNAILLCFVAWVYGYFGSIRGAISYANGRCLSVEEESKSFGTLEPGQEAVVTYHIVNHGRSPVRIIGCRIGCIGRPADALPFTIEPRGSAPLRLLIRAPSARSPTTFPVLLYTNDTSQPQLRLTLTGVVETSGTVRSREQ